MKTRSIRKKEIETKWYLVDANSNRLGKVATMASSLLVGKREVTTVGNLEPGTKVVVINSEKLDIIPKKLENKLYRTHSGYIGGLKEKTLQRMMEKSPERVVELAIKRMLPKSKQGSKMFTNLFVVKGSEHPFKAQKPTEVKVK